MIAIHSRDAKATLSDHLSDTCPAHLDFLRAAGAVFGRDTTIILPEDPSLRKKLEENVDMVIVS